MKKGNNLLSSILWFLAGSIASYFTLQFSLFDIDYEIKIIDTLVSVGTAIIALYVAITIQRKFTKNQNQYTYVERKIDALWANFNNFSMSLIFNDNVELNIVSKYSKELLHSVSFLKNIFTAYELDSNCILVLESKFDDLDQFVLSLEISENIISLASEKVTVQNKIADINLSFSLVLKYIQQS